MPQTREEILDGKKRWRDANKKHISKYSRKYRLLHRSEILQKKKEWDFLKRGGPPKYTRGLSVEERKSRRKETVARYLSKPEAKENFLAKRRARRKKNYHRDYYENIANRLLCLLRGRLYRLTSTKNFRVSYSMLELLGCSIEEFKLHLESQFKDGISWDNYGNGEGNRWQVDHVIACRRFDLQKLEHQRVCFHYTNLSPLWTELNCKKDSSPSIPKLTDEEVHAMHQKIWGEQIIPITQPNKAVFLQEQTAQLGISSS
jgi:hypothetical protein